MSESIDPQFPAGISIPEPTKHLYFERSHIHGLGAFAAIAIPKGTRIIEYVGERIDKSESLRRQEDNNQCVFYLDKEYDLDGNVDWNPARFVNHSCSPNCDAECIDGRIWIVARRAIAAHEEITFNYGYDLTDYWDYPCRCGSRECVGYIVAEEFFPLVNRNRTDDGDSAP